MSSKRISSQRHPDGDVVAPFVAYDPATFRRSLVLLAIAAAVAAAPARAQDESVIARGVKISGTPVGGMTARKAKAAVRASFYRPLRFSFRKRHWSKSPRRLRAYPFIAAAVARALAAAPRTRIVLAVRVNRYFVRRYVASLGRRFARRPRDSLLRLRNLRPIITKSRTGVNVRRRVMRATITRALRSGNRRVIHLRARIVRPRVTFRSFGPIVVIRRESKHLYLYQRMSFVRRFRVATGMAAYPTPLGRFSIVVMARNPWWYPPASDWASGLPPVPPGPGNPLGTRWMGLSVPGVGIHGTPNAASIGYSASHGCIRMRIPEAEWLFRRVRVGTPVFIVRA